MYNSLNWRIPNMPARSYLYSLKPIGLGTPYSESLTSYTTRLADAHCVPTGLLISSEISSYYQENCLLDTKQNNIRNLIGSSEHHRALNGIGVIAIRLSQALEKLTLRTDLSFLTMVTWSEVISAHGLFRPSKAWCPICYEQWCTAGKLIYEPLIWEIELVKVCPVHYQYLKTLCPYCGKKLFSLDWYSRPGYCSKCQKWLGDTSKLASSSMVDLSNEELNWQQSVINNISQLIAYAPNLLSCVERHRIKYMLGTCVNHFFQNKLKSFEDAIGIPHTTLYKWYSGQTLPQLSSLLKICDFYKISLFDFLIKDFDDIEFTNFKKQDKNKAINLKLSSYNQSIDVLAMQQVLNKALNDYPPPTLEDLKLRLGITNSSYFHRYFPELTLEILTRRKQYKIHNIEKKLLNFLEIQNKDGSNPLSITLIATKLKVNYKTLHKYFPDLCNEITDKYLNYIQQHKLEIVSQNRHQIREAIIYLHAKSITPDIKNLISHFGASQKILNKKSILIAKEVWIELGYLDLVKKYVYYT